METNYNWTDNPTENGKSICNTDVLNECLMHLKYNNISESSFYIGTIIQSIVPLNDAALHLLDGSIIEKGIYSDFVDYMAELSTGYLELFCTEAEWTQSVSDYGVCGKFVYNSEANTVRLPKITGFIEGTNDKNAIGDIVTAGLPNLKGEFYTSNLGWPDGYANGVFTKFSNGGRPASGASGSTAQAVNFNASRSSSLYKDNFNKVQPQSVKVLYYISISNSKKTNAELDIDNIAGDINSKVNKDLNNIPANIDYIIDSYWEDKNWWEIYKSGKIRQGGYIPPDSSKGNITLLKEYKSAESYNLIGCAHYTAGYVATVAIVDNKTISYLKANYAVPMTWEACGY